MKVLQTKKGIRGRKENEGRVNQVGGKKNMNNDHNNSKRKRTWREIYKQFERKAHKE